MPVTTREQIMSALFTLVSGSAGFKTTGRRLQLWNKTPNQPALFLRHIADDVEHKSQGMTQLSLVTMHCEVWIYSMGGQGAEDVPDTDINALVDAVLNTLAPDSTNRQNTLGGLVSWCRVEGRIDIAPGDIGPQAIAIIPVKILVPQILAY